MSHRNTPNADLDPFAIIQGHNGEEQFFTLLRSSLVQDRRSKRQMREFLGQDQFGNVYLVYRAVLQDGEEYDVAPNRDGWANRPTLLLTYGGFTDALIDDFRSQAFHVFEETAKSIDASRALADQIGYKGDLSKLAIPTNLESN